MGETQHRNAVRQTIANIEGLSELQRAYELDPLSFETGNILSLVARVSGKMNHSMQILGRLRENNPKNPLVYVGMAEWHLMKGEYTEAQVQLDKGKEVNPGEPLPALDQGSVTP